MTGYVVYPSNTACATLGAANQVAKRESRHYGSTVVMACASERIVARWRNGALGMAYRVSDNILDTLEIIDLLEEDARMRSDIRTVCHNTSPALEG